MKLLTAFSIGIYLDIAMKRGYLGYWVLNKLLDHHEHPSNFYNKVCVLIFCLYVILGIVQSLFLLYIDDSNNLISIICNSNPSTTNSSQSEVIILNEETNNNTANVNIQTVSISNVNIPASAINTAANAVGNGAIVAASIKAAAKVSQSIPSIGGKLAAISSGIVLGGAAIVLKDVASDSSVFGKPSKSYFNSYTDFVITKAQKLSLVRVIKLEIFYTHYRFCTNCK